MALRRPSSFRFIGTWGFGGIRRMRLWRRAFYVWQWRILFHLFGQRKTILWSSVIQIGVINIDSPLSSFLWINHHVRQPIRIFNFPDKLDCQQLVHLRLNDPLPNSGWKCRTFWRTGREEGMTLSRCEAIDEWIPGMLEWVQEGMDICLSYFTIVDQTSMDIWFRFLPPWIGHLGAFDLSFISTIGFHLWAFVAIILPP